MDRTDLLEPDARVELIEGEVVLIIEVSRSTLRYDTDVKVPLYARHGIPSTANPRRTAVPGMPDVTVDLSELLTDPHQATAAAAGGCHADYFGSDCSQPINAACRAIR